MKRPRWFPALMAWCLAMSPVWYATAGDGDHRPFPTTPEQQAELDARVATLIAELGADEFARRERAQAELEGMGLAAFDALHEAQQNEDIEIAMRARYLVRSMSVNWWTETDPPAVRKILKNYGDQTDSERRNRMERLAGLDDAAGIPALCRLMRFETSVSLSKQAALLVMQRPWPTEESEIESLRQGILTSLGLSKRASAEWMRTYVDSLTDPDSTLPRWAEHAAAEQTVLTQFPRQSSRLVVRDLLRWQADLLIRLERQDESLAVIRRTVDLMDDTREQLIELVNWLLQRETWTVVDEVAGRYPDRFENEPQLLYRLAEAQRRRGVEQLARVTAERAFRVAQEDHDEHLRTAYSLQDRGMFDWAEREYRNLSQIGPPGSRHDIDARFMLSEMLHDQGDDLEAAQVLRGIVDVMEKDPAVLKAIERHPFRDPGGLRSRMWFFFASAGQEQETIKEQLTKGWEADPLDADVLIAMYRLKGADDDWKQLTRKRIKDAADTFRDRIVQHGKEAESADRTVLQEWASQNVATANNQLAWLISNTEGDFDEAIQCSHRSLEIRPNTAGYLDTLGRCYYAKGDFEKAVKYQAQAARLDPHSGQLQRQLALFEKALAESSQEESANEEPANEETRPSP